jgi:PIN domain nuclease of toxin-antitoxin system
VRLLLDTHVFLWWGLTPDRLSRRAQDVLEDGENDLLLSAASTWEITIKHGLGRLTSNGKDLGRVMGEAIDRQAVTPLAVEHVHAWRVASLPLLHRDPFDRMLVAQAIVEGVPVLTADAVFARYDVPTLW